MDPGSQDNIEYENCKACNGTGINYFNGPQKKTTIRICQICEGQQKRPIKVYNPNKKKIIFQEIQSKPKPA